MRCFLCGKKGKLISGLCEDCYSKKFSLVELPEEISLIICKRCGKAKIKNRWKKFDVKDFLKFNGKIVKLEIKKLDCEFEISCSGYLQESKKIKSERHKVKVKFKKTTCPECAKERGGYFEVIMQLRGKIPDLDLIDKEIKRETFYFSEKTRGGIDLYIGKKSVARRIASQLKRKNYIIKRSFKLVKVKKGKKIYKETILIRGYNGRS